MPRTLSSARRQTARPNRRKPARRVQRTANEIPVGGRVSQRHVPRSRKSGGASLPRRVPSSRSRCMRHHRCFVPRSGCSDESAATRRASVRVASRKPISGAQRPRPANRYLVRYARVITGSNGARTKAEGPRIEVIVRSSMPVLRRSPAPTTASSRPRRLCRSAGCRQEVELRDRGCDDAFRVRGTDGLPAKVSWPSDPIRA